MKLTELRPQFCRVEFKVETRRCVRPDGSRYDKTGPCQYNIFVDTLAEAQGITFLCPKCFEANKGSVGTHGITCWFRGRGVPDEATPGPGRWDVSGNNYADLTLRPSILLPGEGCGWHGYITVGDISSV